MVSKKTRKVLSSLVLIGLLTSSFSSIRAFADNKVTITDTTGGMANFGRGDASIVIEGNSLSQTIEGKKFNIYKIFDAKNSKNLESINYTLNLDYEEALKKIVGTKLSKDANLVTEYEIIDYIQSLNNNKVEGANTPQTLEGRYSEFRKFVEELRNEIVNLGLQPDTISITETTYDNKVEISGLDYGYYVVDEVSNVENTHSAGSLCMVDTANPSATIKLKSDYPSVIKKIQEDDNKDQIGNDGWNDIGDYEIGQTVPYKFESNVPDMNGYDTYYYAWHDRMDKALTFNENSVKVVISSEDGKSSYTLQNNEFVVVKNPMNDETFKVEIRDLKGIVDAHFNKKDNLNHNVYGQKVTLTFNATLNDEAAKDTGRPGFENEVRLEFSNDADGNGKGKTGTTPWDTVVAFTYRVNGIKTNNHNLELQDAKFRLFSDKDLKNEVFVKKSDLGYIVINRDSAGGNDHTGGNVPQDAVEMVSDEKGVFNIIGLDGGTYWLSETSAPEGYRRLLDPIEIQVVPTFPTDRNSYVKGEGATDKILQRLDATADVKDFFDGILHDNHIDLGTNLDEGSINLNVINKVGAKLPVTGSNLTVILVGTGAILMLGALVLSNRKKLNNSQLYGR